MAAPTRAVQKLQKILANDGPSTRRDYPACLQGWNAASGSQLPKKPVEIFVTQLCPCVPSYRKTALLSGRTLL
jgi:hypothetical protein